jgi:hypothetical protein
MAVSKGHKMDCLWHRIAWIGTVATGAGALVLGVAAVPAAQAPTDEVSIAVFADHYVLEGKSIDDLNVLETKLQAAPDRPIQLNQCGSGTARALKAAAHRFRDRPIDMRSPAADAPQCADAVPTMRRVFETTKPLPLGIDDATVERYWDDSILP